MRKFCGETHHSLEQCAYCRLDKEQLGEERKRKVKAYQFEPVGEQCQNMESLIIRIV